MGTEVLFGMAAMFWKWMVVVDVQYCEMYSMPLNRIVKNREMANFMLYAFYCSKNTNKFPFCLNLFESHFRL